MGDKGKMKTVMIQELKSSVSKEECPERQSVSKELCVKYLLCAKFCSRYWRHSSEQDRLGLYPQGTYILMKGFRQ